MDKTNSQIMFLNPLGARRPHNQIISIGGSYFTAARKDWEHDVYWIDYERDKSKRILNSGVIYG